MENRETHWSFRLVQARRHAVAGPTDQYVKRKENDEEDTILDQMHLFQIIGNVFIASLAICIK